MTGSEKISFCAGIELSINALNANFVEHSGSNGSCMLSYPLGVHGCICFDEH